MLILPVGYTKKRVLFIHLFIIMVCILPVGYTKKKSYSYMCVCSAKNVTWGDMTLSRP